jgi:hypothetical protein
VQSVSPQIWVAHSKRDMQEVAHGGARRATTSSPMTGRHVRWSRRALGPEIRRGAGASLAHDSLATDNGTLGARRAVALHGSRMCSAVRTGLAPRPLASDM